MRAVIKNMNKIFSCRYRGAGFYTEGTSIIDHLSASSVSCRYARADTNGIIEIPEAKSP
jgi:hypothetical protein